MTRILIILLMLAQGLTARAVDTTRAGIPLDATWKAKLYQVASEHSKHTAWGLAHSERDYLLARQIAVSERLSVDPDVLFAAAFLHDIGAQAPYAKDGVNHEPRAVEVMGPVLEEAGFPAQKESAVAEVILKHMYYSQPGASAEAVVFRDADTLDGLGAIGAARVLSTGGNPDGWAPTLQEGLERIQRWQTELPGAFSTATARRMAHERVAELQIFLERLYEESLGGKAL
jgi:uncharacterized protein